MPTHSASARGNVEDWLAQVVRIVRAQASQHPDDETENLLRRLRQANTVQKAYGALDAFQEWAKARHLLDE
jgi:hypothetical protein